MLGKALFIRTDKIGDLVSTLPVDQSQACKNLEITWVIQKGCEFVADHAVPPRKYLAIDKSNWRESLRILSDFLRENKFDFAISFNAPAWVNWALWRSGIAVRGGVLSQWHSFLFLNKGLRQQRSRAEKHEADYNFDLVLHTLGASSPEPTPVLKLLAKDSPQTLEKFCLKNKTYTIVHPGMAGSALNWSVTQYHEKIEELSSQGIVVVTGTRTDEAWLRPLRVAFKNNSKVVFADNQLNATELLVVLACAKEVICPSTGVAHLAASLGTPVKAIYSPIQVHRSIRWGPRSPFLENTQKPSVQIYSPQVPCPEAHHCAGFRCEYFNCMDKIIVK